MAKQAAKKKAIAPVLARPGDPYVHANGRIIRPKDLPKKRKEDEPERLSSANFKSSKRRALSDLPATPNIVTGCAVIFMYSVLGVGDREIAKAANLTVEQIAQIREHPSYGECFDLVVGEFINANSALLAARIAGYSHMALDKVAEVAEYGTQENNRLRASTEILGMAGIGGSKKGAGDGANGEGHELRIVVLEGTEQHVQVELDGEAFDGNQMEVIDG